MAHREPAREARKLDEIPSLRTSSRSRGPRTARRATGMPACYSNGVVDWSVSLRPELAELTSYVPADPPGVRVRLDANEAPSPPDGIRAAVAPAVAATALERYPDARARALKARIAERAGAPPEGVLVGTGADEIIGIR